MRFPMTFNRVVDGVADTLGTDAVPTTRPSASADNQFACKLYNVNGFPLQRLAVGYTTNLPNHAGKDVTVAVWLWDDTSSAWYQVGSAALKDGTISYFDVPALMDNPQRVRDDYANAGSCEVCLVAAKPGGADVATYTFICGADVSNPAL